MSSIDGKFASAPGLKAAFAYRPSPPLRAGDPIRPPKNGKGAQDDTARQKIFAQAIWDLAVQSNNKRFPARFVLDDEGKVYFDQGCIDMARDWLDATMPNPGGHYRCRSNPRPGRQAGRRYPALHSAVHRSVAAVAPGG